MGESILTALITGGLSLTGVVSCIRFLLFRLYKSKNDKTIMLITPTREDILHLIHNNLKVENSGTCDAILIRNA